MNIFFALKGSKLFILIIDKGIFLTYDPWAKSMLLRSTDFFFPGFRCLYIFIYNMNSVLPCNIILPYFGEVLVNSLSLQNYEDF